MNFKHPVEEQMRLPIRSRPGTTVLVLFLALLPVVASAQEAQTITVKATGESAVSFDQAEEKALRNAVRRGVGVVLASETKTADFVLIRHSICSRAAGYVRSYDVIRKLRGLDDTYIVEIQAEVARGKIADDHLAIKNLIELKGRPRMEVVLSDEPDDEAEREAGRWVRAGVEKSLVDTGFTVVDLDTWRDTIERQQKRAEVNDEARKAALLGLQLGAAYQVKIDQLTCRKSEDRAWGIDVTTYGVKLNVKIVHKDIAETDSQVNGAGMVRDTGNLGGVAWREAANEAVRGIFAELRDRMLRKWLEDIDVGRAVIVQLYDVPYTLVSDLARKIETLEGVMKVKLTEAPAGGIANIRVIGRIEARAIADRIPSLTGGRLKAATEGRRMVTAEPAAESPRSVPPPDAGGGGQSGSSAGGASPAGAQPGGQAPASTSQNTYVVPAAILGGCLLVGIVLAALILGRK